MLEIFDGIVDRHSSVLEALYCFETLPNILYPLLGHNRSGDQM